MRIAALMETFPAWSETYILWHISELVRAGQSVAIMPAARGRSTLVQPEVRELALLDKLYVSERSTTDVQQVARSLLSASLRHPICTGRLLLGTALAGDRTGWSLSISNLALRGRVPRRFDVLHAYFGPSGRRAATLRAIGALRGALVTSFLGFDANVLGTRLGARYYRDLFRRAERIGVSSEFMRNKLQALGAPNSRIVKLPLGLPIERYAFRARSYENGPLRLISVGRLAEVKGVEWAVRGVALAHERGYPVELDVVGDGPLMVELKALCAQLRVEGIVRFHGAQDSARVRELVDASHVALYTGIKARDGAEEALGGSVLEAQAMGLPVIATDAGGVREGLVPERSGLVIEQRSAEAVAVAIQALLERSAEWPEMGRIGRAHIEEHFDSKRLHQRWMSLYRDLAP
jgi:colanic acid/amylovoran biosynthesis glycosyltransferase